MKTVFNRWGRTAISLASAAFTAALPLHSQACPLIGGLVDYNCDGRHKVVATGDSFVSGIGDDEIDPKIGGGYMVRLQEHFPESDFTKVGFPGINAQRLLKFYRQLVATDLNSKIGKRIAAADVLILDFGRNGYFSQETPEYTVTAIRRLAALIQESFQERFQYAPLIVISTLAPTTRAYQRTYIAHVNDTLLVLKDKGILPALLRFDQLNPDKISSDGLHPSPAGHAGLARIAAEYLANEGVTRSLKGRKDADADGVFDLFERAKFRTKLKVADTDGDGLLDGEEIFVYKTSPLTIDSDGDGISDFDEVHGRTDDESLRG
jgi:lysophospholipase L1-like esterase